MHNKRVGAYFLHKRAPKQKVPHFSRAGQIREKGEGNKASGDVHWENDDGGYFHKAELSVLLKSPSSCVYILFSAVIPSTLGIFIHNDLSCQDGSSTRIPAS